jgi:hypothetical protein
LEGTLVSLSRLWTHIKSSIQTLLVLDRCTSEVRVLFSFGRRLRGGGYGFNAMGKSSGHRTSVLLRLYPRDGSVSRCKLQIRRNGCRVFDVGVTPAHIHLWRPHAFPASSPDIRRRHAWQHNACLRPDAGVRLVAASVFIGLNRFSTLPDFLRCFINWPAHSVFRF